MAEPPPNVGFKRTLLLPGLIFGTLEIVFVVLPLFPLFQPTEEQRLIAYRAALPFAAGGLTLWWAALTAWLAPVQRLLGARRRGESTDALQASAYQALDRLPLRSFALRVCLWLANALALGLLMVRYSDWSYGRVASLVSIVGLHAGIVSILRAAWTLRLASRLRGPLFPTIAPLQILSDRIARRVLFIALLVGAGAAAAHTAFVYYFVPIKPEEYLALQTYLPGLTALMTIGWVLFARRARRPIDVWLRAELGGRAPEGSPDPRAFAAYRGAQSLPYRLAGGRLVAWVLAAGAAALLARELPGIESDNATLLFGAALVINIGAALYEAIWHRETLRPLLLHVAVVHRLPVREVRSLSLRGKLLISFGGLVLFACGLSLFWGFIQYKTLATAYLSRQAQLTLDWVASEVQGRAAQAKAPPSQVTVRQVLSDAAASSPDGAVFYYVPADGARADGIGGGPDGAPRLPWYAAIRLHAARRGSLEVLNLAGKFQRLDATWDGGRVDLGVVAVVYPGYRGRGPGIQRPLLELGVFFLILFGVCAGIVVLTVSEFVGPIRKLEQRADEMARGELSRSVASSGEGDEVGRLTFALEEMRRALREKIRSTEEVNLDLEREVQRRTADLAKKNRELAEALQKLTRAQSQLVRAEKMASIGQLVAGIAHEINNPVNAIANTVGPLREAIEGVAGGGSAAAMAEAASDIEHMMRVIQNGARRTQSIVQALHNYSRTDEERIVELDINRGLDDSLELLRHHLKGQIAVNRRYADVGRVRGHAGQLNQVFMNLLTNAAQAVSGRDGAQIDVVTRRNGGSVVIEVVDNGPGIPPEILPKIFDPFFTTKEVGQGSGLGLSIVHGIVERHGGAIEVDSLVGRGTTFTLTLPADGR